MRFRHNELCSYGLVVRDDVECCEYAYNCKQKFAIVIIFIILIFSLRFAYNINKVFSPQKTSFTDKALHLQTKQIKYS